MSLAVTFESKQSTGQNTYLSILQMKRTRFNQTKWSKSANSISSDLKSDVYKALFRLSAGCLSWKAFSGQASRVSKFSVTKKQGEITVKKLNNIGIIILIMHATCNVPNPINYAVISHKPVTHITGISVWFILEK